MTMLRTASALRNRFHTCETRLYFNCPCNMYPPASPSRHLLVHLLVDDKVAALAPVASEHCSVMTALSSRSFIMTSTVITLFDYRTSTQQRRAHACSPAGQSGTTADMFVSLFLHLSHLLALLQLIVERAREQPTAHLQLLRRHMRNLWRCPLLSYCVGELPHLEEHGADEIDALHQLNVDVHVVRHLSSALELFL